MTPLLPTPDSWAWTTLGDIADVVGGVTKDAKKQSDPNLPLVPYLRVANVQRGRLDLTTVTEIRVPEATAERLQLLPGDVLLNEGGDRDKLGRGWVWDGEIPNCIHQNHVFRARVIDGILDPRLLAWFANECAQTWFETNGKQTTNLASISLSRIKELPLPIPPLAEQQRIVTILNDRLAEVDAAISALTQANGRVGRYLEAVVARELDHIESVELGTILAEKLINGRSVPTRGDGFPVLRLTAMASGYLDLSERKGGDWTEREARPHLVKRGDFFVSRGNGSLSLVGRGALLMDEPDPVAFPDTMIRIRADRERIDSEFLRVVWQSYLVRQQIEGAARTTAGIYKINQSILEGIRIPLPPLEKQAQIVATIQEAEALVGTIGGAATVSISRCRDLRRRLFGEAFRGRLTQPEVGDELAEGLLDRIRLKRAAEAMPRNRTKRGVSRTGIKKISFPADAGGVVSAGDQESLFEQGEVSS
ncbi:restriction endonuclease subunit S [Nonomuraea sp. NPDC049028]|uniref:restriction endonuclease subunit S n=1 Tax=Nonomuraea sp. NPDC049028 TaxID=3364348 RepID=UPI0037211EA2